MTAHDDRKFPKVFNDAVKKKMISAEHMDRALDIQHSQIQKGVYQSLEDVLCDNKFVSPGLRDRIAEQMFKYEKLFCEIAVQQGVASQEDVDYVRWLKVNVEGGCLYCIDDLLIHSEIATAEQCSRLFSLLKERLREIPGPNEEPISAGVSSGDVSASGGPDRYPMVKDEPQVQPQPDTPSPGPDSDSMVKDEQQVQPQPDTPSPGPDSDSMMKGEQQVEQQPDTPSPGPDSDSMVKDEQQVQPQPDAPSPGPDSDPMVKDEQQVQPSPDAPAFEPDTDSVQNGEYVKKTSDSRKEAGSQDGLQLSFLKDGLEAWLYPAKDLKEPPTVDEVMEVLKAHGVVYGIIDEGRIAEKIKINDPGESRFMVALGKPPVPAEDASVKYHFDTEYLNAGIIRDDGSIDFKDRGRLPFAEQGDLLAEKKPAVPGREGMDVFGSPIPVAEAQDISVKGGAGTVPGDDDLKLFASVSGRPDLAMDGTVSVFNELEIKGDVDYNTGHIDFEGNVIIRGVVQSGFKVSAVNLVADEIAGGQISITGDLCVSRGIINSTVSAGGAVQAKHIIKSDIEAFGDIIIQKEIIESNILVSGACNVNRGKIIGSKIAASRGVEAGQIGTHSSSPCILKIGSPLHLISEKDKIDLVIGEKELALEASLEKLRVLTLDQEATQKKLADDAQAQDRSQVKLRELRGVRDAHAGNQSEIAMVDSQIGLLEEEIDALDKSVAAGFDMDELLSGKRSLEVESQESLKIAIGLLEEKKTLLDAWGAENRPEAVIGRCRLICARTSVAGPNSAVILREDAVNSEIREVRTPEVGWEMKVG